MEFDVHVGLGTLLGAHRAVRARHAVIEHHHVVLDHAEPLRLRILPGAGRLLLALQRLTLRDVRTRAIQAGLFVVPENEANRAVGLHVGTAENARELHDERGAGAVVVRGLAPAVTVHVAADDVHLVRVDAADLRAVHLLPLAVGRRLRVERANLRIRLRERIGVHASADAVAAKASAALRDCRSADVAAAGRAPGVRGGGDLYSYVMRSVFVQP